MTMSQDTHINYTDRPTSRPVIDVPVLSDASTSNEFVEHRSFPQPLHIADACQAADDRANLVDPLVRINSYVRRKLSKLRQQTTIYSRRINPYVTFSRALLTGPRSIGAVCPSSPYLARAMAGELDLTDNGLVLELGAGTGSITSALLQQGIAPERLIVVERSAALAAHLRERFPALRVIEGDATQLSTLLGNDIGRVQAVVSGLPLRSLTRSVVTEIAQQIRQLLPGGGVFIQFTYDLRTPSVCKDTALRRARSQVIWKNLPPARVDTFVRLADTP